MTPSDDDLLAPSDDLDGHTLEELSDYLARGREPRDESIESSPGCRLAMIGLRRLHDLSWDALDHEAKRRPGRDDDWIGRLLVGIRDEVRSGRDVPVRHPDPNLRLTITEGAVRGLVRGTGDATGLVVVGRCTLDGDLTSPGATVRVSITAAARYGAVLQTVADEVRDRVREAVAIHTGLVVENVDVTIDDVFTE